MGDVKKPLYVLLGATCCLLLIACLNVANLLVARAAARRKELAIRTALGGGWLRLVRERLLESLLLSAAGGALGLLLAVFALAWLTRIRHDMTRVESIHIDGAVAAFTVGIIVLCALFSGLIAAFSTSGKRILGALHEASRSVSGGGARAALRKGLLAVEVGLTVVLLIGAGLLLMHAIPRPPSAPASSTRSSRASAPCPAWMRRPSSPSLPARDTGAIGGSPSSNTRPCRKAAE